MAFEIIKDINSNPARKIPVSSITVVAGDLLELTAGSANWALCTSTSNFFTRKAVALEANAAVANSSVLAQELNGNEQVRAESANNSAAADNGDRMTLTDANTVNNTGTDVTGQAVSFVQTGTAGVVADKRIVGYVLVGSGVDPDAA